MIQSFKIRFRSVDDADRWVTVFGFPPAAASAVLAQFSQLGHIVEHRFPGQGNWVNLCYQTRLDARRALSYNGKVLPSHVMVGVLPCRDSVSILFMFPLNFINLINILIIRKIAVQRVKIMLEILLYFICKIFPKILVMY